MKLEGVEVEEVEVYKLTSPLKGIHPRDKITRENS